MQLLQKNLLTMLALLSKKIKLGVKKTPTQ
jgi:hypothetical protein